MASKERNPKDKPCVQTHHAECDPLRCRVRRNYLQTNELLSNAKAKAALARKGGGPNQLADQRGWEQAAFKYAMEARSIFFQKQTRHE